MKRVKKIKEPEKPEKIKYVKILLIDINNTNTNSIGELLKIVSNFEQAEVFAKEYIEESNLKTRFSKISEGEFVRQSLIYEEFQVLDNERYYCDLYKQKVKAERYIKLEEIDQDILDTMIFNEREKIEKFKIQMEEELKIKESKFLEIFNEIKNKENV